MAKDFVTASELNQLALSWGVVHIVSTLAIIGNVILNYKFKPKGRKRLYSQANNENKPMPLFPRVDFANERMELVPPNF